MGIRKILYQCLRGDISAINQLYSRVTLPKWNINISLVSNFRQTFHLFSEYGELPALYQYPRLSLKPQYSLGEFKKNSFWFSESAGNHQKHTIRPSCNCFEWHIIMQYCPVANYHDVHNLWQSVSGGMRTFLCFGYFLKMESFRSELLTGH